MLYLNFLLSVSLVTQRLLFSFQNTKKNYMNTIRCRIVRNFRMCTVAVTAASTLKQHWYKRWWVSSKFVWLIIDLGVWVSESMLMIQPSASKNRKPSISCVQRCSGLSILYACIGILKLLSAVISPLAWSWLCHRSRKSFFRMFYLN